MRPSLSALGLLILLAAAVIEAPSLQPLFHLLLFLFSNLLLILLARTITLRYYSHYGLLDRIVTGALLFFVLVLGVCLCCGFAGVFSLSAVSTLSIAIFAVAAFRYRPPPMIAVSNDLNNCPKPISEIYIAAALILLYLGPILIIFTRQFGRPPLNWDCFHYHCTIAATWLQSQSFWTKPPLLGAENFPFNGEVFFAWVLLPFRGDILLPLVQQLFYGYALVAAFALSRRFSFNVWQSLLSVLPLLAMAGVVDNAVNAKTDMVPLSLFLCAVNFFYKLREERDQSALPLLLLALSLLAGSKYTGLLQAACFLPLLFFYWRSLGPGERRNKFLRRLLIWSAVASPFSLCWYVRLDIPQLFSSILYHYPRYLAVVWEALSHPQYAMSQLIVHRAWLNWGVAFLIVLPCMGMIASAKMRARLFPRQIRALIYLVAALWGIYFVLPFSTSVPTLRYIFPVFPLLGILTAAGLDAVPVLRRRLEYVAAGAYVVSALPFFPYFFYKVPGGFSLGNIVPAAVILGISAAALLQKRPSRVLSAAVIGITLPALLLLPRTIGHALHRYSEAWMPQIEASGLYEPFAPAWSYLRGEKRPVAIGVFGACLLYPSFGEQYRNSVSYQDPKTTSSGWLRWILGRKLTYYLIAVRKFDMNDWYYTRFALIQRRRLSALGPCVRRITLRHSQVELYELKLECISSSLRHSRRARREFGRRALLEGSALFDTGRFKNRLKQGE